MLRCRYCSTRVDPLTPDGERFDIEDECCFVCAGVRARDGEARLLELVEQRDEHAPPCPLDVDQDDPLVAVEWKPDDEDDDGDP